MCSRVQPNLGFFPGPRCANSFTTLAAIFGYSKGLTRIHDYMA